MDKVYKCKMAIIRLIPNPIRGERINIGLVLHCSEEEFILCEFDHVKLKLITMLFNIDMEFVNSIFLDLKDKFDNQNLKDIQLLNIIKKHHSNIIRLSSPKGLLTESLHTEFGKLFKEYVE